MRLIEATEAMIIIDAHLDLSLNALNWNRDLTQPVAAIRAAEQGMAQQGRGANTVALPDMRSGDVAIAFATVLARYRPQWSGYIDFHAQTIASAMARGQLAYYRILENQGEMRQIRTRDDLDRHVDAWKKARGAVGYVLAMEGADPILGLDDLDYWWDAGLRLVGPAHFGEGPYAAGTGTPGPLTARGVELVRALDSHGFALDVTHLADEAFWQALDLFSGPIAASHHNCRALVPGDRQLTDDQIRALIERDAVIGAALDIWMLVPGFETGKTVNTAASLETVADHIDHVCQLAGDARHSAIGSDLDGEFGTEQTPHDVETIADLQRLCNVLSRRGYTERDIEGITHGNWIRFLRRALPQGGSSRA